MLGGEAVVAPLEPQAPGNATQAQSIGFAGSRKAANVSSARSDEDRTGGSFRYRSKNEDPFFCFLEGGIDHFPSFSKLHIWRANEGKLLSGGVNGTAKSCTLGFALRPLATN